MKSNYLVLYILLIIGLAMSSIGILNAQLVNSQISNNYTSVFSYQDPVDDRSLILPTGPNYAWGDSDMGHMDLRNFEVLTNSTHIVFEFQMGHLMNPYSSSKGFSLTFVSLYIDHKVGGVQNTVVGEQVQTLGLWDTALIGDATNDKVFFSNNTEEATTKSTGFIHSGDIYSKTISFEIPISTFGVVPDDTWQYYVLVGAEYYGLYYEPVAEPGVWQLGGGIDENYEPNIIDMAVPGSLDTNQQDLLLNNYNPEDEAIVYPVGVNIDSPPNNVVDQILPTSSSFISTYEANYQDKYLFETQTNTRNVGVTVNSEDSGVISSGISLIEFAINNSVVHTHTVPNELVYSYNVDVELSLGYQEINITVVDDSSNTHSNFLDLYLTQNYIEDNLAPSANLTMYDLQDNVIANFTETEDTFFDYELKIVEEPTNQLSELHMLEVKINGVVGQSYDLSGNDMIITKSLLLNSGIPYKIEFIISDSLGNEKSITFYLNMSENNLNDGSDPNNSQSEDENNDETSNERTIPDTTLKPLNLSWIWVLTGLCIVCVNNSRTPKRT